MDEIGKSLGAPVALRLADRVIDVYPVRLKDWPDFAPVLFALEMENLHEVHFFGDGPIAFHKALQIVLRLEEIPEIVIEITQAEFKRLRDLVIQQNELDFTRLHKKVEAYSGKGDPKNV